jgi:outer membrane lipoprotein-sorting protein
MIVMAFHKLTNTKLALTALTVLLTTAKAFSQEPSVDTRAKGVLAEMVAAYRKLRTLDQESTYAASGSALGRLIKSRLVVQRPNKLFLEMTERTPELPQPVVRRYQSDGKSFYSYFESHGVFTMAKAPKDLSGFKDLATNLEMAALAGVDPFATLARQARSVKMEEPAEAGGMPVDVVAVDFSDEFRTGEARLYIGKEDRLLRRFTFDTTPTPRPPPPKTETTPDPDELPLDPPLPPKPTHFEYESKVSLNKEVGKDTFKWIAPPGAMLMREDPLAYLDQSRKDRKRAYQLAEPIDFSNVAEPKDLSKPTKKVFASDLIKKATKPKK